MTTKERESLTVQVALILVQEGCRHSPASNLRATALLASEAAKAFVADLVPQPRRRTKPKDLNEARMQYLQREKESPENV